MNINPPLKYNDHRAVDYMKHVKRILKIMRERWYLFLLLAVILSSFWVRTLPIRHYELTALDPFYFYRITENMLENNLQLPERDFMRNYPLGHNPNPELLGAFYIPVVMYLIFAGAVGLFGSQLLYFDFIMYYGAIMGALSAAAMYLLGKEFHDHKTGLFSAFFLGFVPAFLTRTSGASIEKEPAISVFMILFIALFIAAYRREGYFSMILSGLAGISLFIVTWTSSIVFYYYILMAMFGLILVIFSNKQSQKLLTSYVPMGVVSLVLGMLTPANVAVQPPIMFFAFVVVASIIKHYLQHSSYIKQEYKQYIGVGIVGVVFIASFVLAFADISPFNVAVSTLTSIATLNQDDPLGYTVAENQPGSLNHALSSSDARAAIGLIPSLSPIESYVSIWIFAFIGIAIACYQLFKTRKFLYIFPILWFISSVIAVTFQIRFLFLFGPPVAFLGGYGISALINFISSRTSQEQQRQYLLFIGLGFLGTVLGFVGYVVTILSAGAGLGAQLLIPVLVGALVALLLWKKIPEKEFQMIMGLYVLLSLGLWYAYERVFLLYFSPLFFVIFLGYLFYKKEVKIKFVALGLIILFAGLVVGANFVNGYGYSRGIGPSICFPQNEQPCKTLDENNNFVYAEGQPWYQAMEFLDKNTDKTKAVISWWDFGYWFETAGNKPSVTDGGFGPRHEVAWWFINTTNNWDFHETWLAERQVDVILMDYTLPGKYGAITAIGTNGQNLQNTLQLQRSNQFTQNGQNIVEFSGGPFVVWAPIDGNSFTGTPILLANQNGQLLQQGFINDVCTNQGIATLGNQTPNVGGCLAITSFGFFYIPEPVKNTIFASLMFMDGAGLPVEKVFDNQLIKIYRINYSTPLSSSQ